MRRENKIAILGFGTGLLLFYLLEKTVLSKKGLARKVEKSEPSDQDIEIAFGAYQEAVQDGADAATLKALNEKLGSQYNLQVQQSNDQLFVTDMAGNKIATYQTA